MKNFSISANYCLYNEEDYIEYSLRSIYNFVDIINICLATKPWTGEEEEKDGTEQIIRNFLDPDGKIKLNIGFWGNQKKQREELVKMYLESKTGYFWLIDGDEVYKPKRLHLIAEAIEDFHPEEIRASWFTHWRSLHYVVSPLENYTFIMRKGFEKLKFSRREAVPSTKSVVRLPRMLHHFSYAKKPERIKHKISNFSHRDEIYPGWFEYVFLAWEQNKELKNLHPIKAAKYKQIIKLSEEELPQLLKTHPWHGKEIIK